MIINSIRFPFEKFNEYNIKHKNISHLKVSHFNIDQVVNTDLNHEEAITLKQFLNRNKKTFYIEGQYLTTTNCIKHKRVTNSTRPIYCENSSLGKRNR